MWYRGQLRLSRTPRVPPFNGGPDAGGLGLMGGVESPLRLRWWPQSGVVTGKNLAGASVSRQWTHWHPDVHFMGVNALAVIFHNP